MNGSRNNQQGTLTMSGTPQRLHARLPMINRDDDIVHHNHISEVWYQILIGSVLGDGCFTPVSKKRGEAQLFFGCDDRHLEYLEWLHHLLEPLGVRGIKPKRGFHQHYFYTHPSIAIGRLRSLFYPHGKKIVPEEINQLLVSPLALAVWYQDDGTLDARARYHWNAKFATYCFSKNDCDRLAETLRANFDLHVTVARCVMREKIYWQLYVRSRSMERFVKLVSPFIRPSFLYKIRQA